MTKSQLERLLREAGNLARDRDFFLIGSQALRGVCPAMPRGFPRTREADLYPRHHPQAWAVLRKRLGKGSGFFKRNGYFLDCTDPALSTIPDGWLERLDVNGVSGDVTADLDLFAQPALAESRLGVLNRTTCSSASWWHGGRKIGASSLECCDINWPSHRSFEAESRICRSRRHAGWTW